MNRANNNKTAVQKYCKVCQDAGKTEAEFRSHYTRETRDPNSSIVCPTLLSLECRYCYKNGHTIKYCPFIKERVKQPRHPVEIIKTDEKPTHFSINTFDCLNCESDNEDSPNVIINQALVVDEFPELVHTKQTVPSHFNNISYATALSTVVLNPKVINPKVIKTKAVPNLTNSIKTVSAISWAEMDESSDEEEMYISNVNSKNMVDTSYGFDW